MRSFGLGIKDESSEAILSPLYRKRGTFDGKDFDEWQMLTFLQPQ